MGLFAPDRPAWYLFRTSDGARSARSVRDGARADLLAAAALAANFSVSFHDPPEENPWAGALRAAAPSSPRFGSGASTASSPRSPRTPRSLNKAKMRSLPNAAASPGPSPAPSVDRASSIRFGGESSGGGGGGGGGGVGDRVDITDRADIPIRGFARFGETMSSVASFATTSDAAERAAASRHHLLSKMHLDHGLSDEQILGQLRKVQWFRSLSFTQLRVLYARAKHMFFSRYSTVIREGNEGNAFFLLLQGKVHVSAAALPDGPPPVNVTLGAGACFGEGALVATIRREASVTAMDDCYLLQFESADMEGLPVDLSEVRVHVIHQILKKVPFFKQLGEREQLKLANIAELQYVLTGETIFAEGDIGDRLYILVEGSVNMLKRTETAGPPDENQKHIEPSVVARYSAASLELPWFGELAIAGSGSKPRAATAVCDDPTKLLVVHADHFATFVEVVPLFSELFQSSQKGFAAMNMLMRDKKDLTTSLGDAIRAFEDIATGDFTMIKSTMPLTAAEGKWERVVTKLLAVANGEVVASDADQGGGGAGDGAGSGAPAAAPAAEAPKGNRRGSGGAGGGGASKADPLAAKAGLAAGSRKTRIKIMAAL